MTERTLSIIKPDAVKKGLIGTVLAKFQNEGIHIAALKMVRLTREKAQAFYAVHEDKPFFAPLTDFMISGPIVVVVLEGEGMIERNRTIMGATDPKKAAPGTIRAEFADNIQENIVHGSDSPQTASQEIPFFFSEFEIS